MELVLGGKTFRLDDRAVVLAILNRTRDSFYDRGRHFKLDALLRQAEQDVADGADVLEVGARPGGLGVREVSVDEECHLVAETLEELRGRFDCPLAVDTTRASVAAIAFSTGAVLGNDMSGFRDAAYLETAKSAGAAVVATHIRKPPAFRILNRSSTMWSARSPQSWLSSPTWPSLPGCRVSGSSSTPGSTSERPGNSRSPSSPLQEPSPTWVIHFSWERRTRSSWAERWAAQKKASGTSPRQQSVLWPS